MFNLKPHLLILAAPPISHYYYSFTRNGQGSCLFTFCGTIVLVNVYGLAKVCIGKHVLPSLFSSDLEQLF